MTTNEALDSLREAAEEGKCDSHAVETLAYEIVRLRSLANRVIDAGVTRWHEPEIGKEISLVDWLEISEAEYAEWVQRTGLFAGDAKYYLDDDERVLKGYNAIKQMHILRIGDMKDHAQAFRDALNE